MNEGGQGSAGFMKPTLEFQEELDEARQGEEAIQVKRATVPRVVNQAEKDEHELAGHVAYRAWCRHCVAAAGHGTAHRPAEDYDNVVPELVMDYFFMGQDEAKVAPHIVMKDRKSSAFAATTLEAKSSKYGVAYLAGFIKELGYRRIVLKSDGEPAIVKLKERLAMVLPTVEIVPKESVEDDPRSNGAAEGAVKEVKGKTRALKSSTEDRLGKRIPATHPLLAWMPRFQSQQLTRYRVLDDGQTLVQRLTGRRWRRPALLYAERVMFKPVQPRFGRRRGYDGPMELGTYVGHHSRSGTLIMLTEFGVKKGQTFRRLPADERFGGLEFNNLKGVPWDLKPVERVALPMLDFSEVPAIPIAIPVSTEPAVVRKRGFYVLTADVLKYGGTQSCTACDQILENGRANATHSVACRVRIEAALALDEEGRKRLQKRKATESRSDRPAAAEPTDHPEPVGIDIDVEEAVGGPEEPPQSAPSGVKRQASKEVVSEQPAASSRTRLEPSTTPKRPLEATEDIENKRQELADRTDIDGDIEVQDAAPDPADQQLASLQLSKYKHKRLEDVEAFVAEKYRREAVDISAVQLTEVTQLLVELSAVHFAEMFSPERFAQRGKPLGLLPGIAVDLSTRKANGEFWDLRKEEDQKELEVVLEEQLPELLIGSPPCAAHSVARTWSNRKRDPKVVQELDEADKLLEVGCRFYDK